VVPNAWKWPASWPFAGDNFAPSDEAKSISKLYGDEPVDSNIFDDDCSAKFAAHCAKSIDVGSSVLDIGAGTKTHLPSSLNLERLVGLGLNGPHLEQNDALDERVVFDLNRADIESFPFADDEFDAVVMTNTVEFLVQPRAVFREIWRVLKPGGIAIIGFTSANNLKNGHEGAQVKMWKGFNDPQHIWSVGAYFQFSAGAGWRLLSGYEIVPEKQPLAMGGGDAQQLMTVQATKVSEGSNPPPPPLLRHRVTCVSHARTCEEREAG
jgi:SAM-dependent methyltransferase